MRAFLQGQGYRALTASSGEEALLLCVQERPYLIMLDINMPGMNGIEVWIAISDNGPGISQEEQELIFDKFGQAMGGRKQGGSGLGLAFCKLAVEAQHGRIGVASAPGKGSTFWFTLPAWNP